MNGRSTTAALGRSSDHRGLAWSCSWRSAPSSSISASLGCSAGRSRTPPTPPRSPPRVHRGGGLAATRAKMHSACFYAKQNGFFADATCRAQAARTPANCSCTGRRSRGRSRTRHGPSADHSATHPSFFGRFFGVRRRHGYDRRRRRPRADERELELTCGTRSDEVRCRKDARQRRGDDRPRRQPRDRLRLQRWVRPCELRMRQRRIRRRSAVRQWRVQTGRKRGDEDRRTDDLHPRHLRADRRHGRQPRKRRGAPAPDPMAGLVGPRQEAYPAGHCPKGQGGNDRLCPDNAHQHGC